MEKKCPICGKQADQEDRYCSGCGVDFYTLKEGSGELRKQQKLDKILVVVSIIAIISFVIFVAVAIKFVKDGYGALHRPSKPGGVGSSTLVENVPTSIPTLPATTSAAPSVPANTAPTTTAPVFQESIEETVVYDEDGVRLTVKSIKKTAWGTEIAFLLENETELNIALSCYDFNVNGITISGSLRIKAAAGKKANDTLSFSNSDLDIAGIEHIATIETYDAKISNTDTYKNIRSIAFSVHTSADGLFEQHISEDGDLIFDANGIIVISKGIREEFTSYRMVLLIENHTGRDISLRIDNTSVNGYTISNLGSDPICKGTVRFCELTIYKSDLDENEIETIQEVTFTLDIINPETYSTYFTTEELKVNAEIEER